MEISIDLSIVIASYVINTFFALIRLIILLSNLKKNFRVLTCTKLIEILGYSIWQQQQQQQQKLFLDKFRY